MFGSQIKEAVCNLVSFKKSLREYDLTISYLSESELKNWIPIRDQQVCSYFEIKNKKSKLKNWICQQAKEQIPLNTFFIWENSPRSTFE